MSGITRKTDRKSFNLYSGFTYYAPGIGGTLMLLVMLLAGALVGNLLTLLMSTVSDIGTATSIGLIITYPVMFIPAMLYASFQSRRNELFQRGYALDSNNFGKLNTAFLAVMCAVVTIAGSIMTDPLSSVLPPMPDNLKAIMENMVSNSPLWATVLTTVIFAPVFEEWLCRGMILRGLLQKTKPVWAICLSALVFAIIHGNIWQGIPAFILGVLFGYVYYRTGSLKLTMLMHLTNNAFAVITSRLPSIKEMGMDATLSDILDKWQYISLMAAGMFIIVIFIDIVKKNILLKSPNGNCDIIDNDGFIKE